MINWLEYFTRGLIGKPQSRQMLRRDFSDSKLYPDRLRDFQAKILRSSSEYDSDINAQRPIFVLSAGWRSGSTLVQRMLMHHNDDLIIWGEPYDRTNLFDRLMLQFNAFTKDWPPDRFYHEPQSTGLSHRWVANLYPSLNDFFDAHRSFFDSLFLKPATELGYQSWGVKEVRLTGDHARYLKLLYPNARFIFLVRHPVHAFASYRPTGEWYRSWTDKPVFTPFAFGRNWSSLAGSFFESFRDVDGILIRYEDLNQSNTVSSIENYLGWKVSKADNVMKVGSSKKSDKELWVPKFDRCLLRLGLNGTEKKFGYQA